MPPGGNVQKRKGLHLKKSYKRKNFMLEILHTTQSTDSPQNIPVRQNYSVLLTHTAHAGLGCW